MKTQSIDTSPVIENMLVEGYRRMSPAQKLQRVEALNQAVRQLATARLRQQYGPDLPARELQLRLAALWLSDETMRRVFGWDPDLQGR
jgi:hypothetical protein